MTPTPEQVAAWALVAGFQPHRSGRLIAMHSNGSWVGLDEELNRFAALACAWQAEQDAKLCDAMQYTGDTPQNCAAAIRASVKGGA